MNRLIAPLTAAFFFVTANALGLTVIDFRDSSFNPGDSSFFSTQLSIDGYVISLEVSATAGHIYWDSVDGYGVWGGENDEIDHNELLSLSFTPPSGVNLLIQQIQITDLFYESGDFESGYYALDGGIPTLFVQDNTSAPNGAYTIALTPTAFNQIVFSANPQASGHEFSVQGLTLAAGTIANPEPASIILLSSGLIGFAAWRWKQRTGKRQGA